MKLRSLLVSLPLLLFIGIGLFFWKGLQLNPHIVPSVLIGKHIPTFNMPALNKDNSFISNQNIKGKIVLLNVWASWCMTCRAEQPMMMNIAASISPSKKFTIYGLNYKDDRTRAKSWLKQFGNPFKKIIYDPNGTLATNLGVYGTPETFIIDRDGVIRDKVIGPITEDIWKHRIWPLVKKLQATSS